MSGTDPVLTTREYGTGTWFLYGFAWMAFLSGHVLYLSNVDGIGIYPDSGEYYEFSRLHSLTDSRFWGGLRPPVALLFYRLFGGYDYGPMWDWTRSFHAADATLLHAQTTFSLAAFSFLAFACARTARTGKGRFALFVFPLLFSLAPPIARWNFTAHSESLSISLFAVFVAAWILFLSTRRSSWLAGVALTALFWGGARDTNAYVLVMIAGVIVTAMVANAMAASTKSRQAPLPIPLTVICILFVVIFTLSNFSAEAGGRWVFPFYNVMGKRILPVPERVSYFADHGMPIGPALLEQAGKWASDDGFVFYNDPRLEEFRAWTASHGKATYVKFLASHFIYSATAPAFDFPLDFLSLACAFHLDPVKGYGIAPGYRISAYSLACLICFLIVNGLRSCLALVSWRRGWLHRFPHLAVPLVMVLLSIPHGWLTWHGDAMETARHGLPAYVVQFPLGFSLLWLYIWDHGASCRAAAARGRSGAGRDAAAAPAAPAPVTPPPAPLAHAAGPRRQTSCDRAGSGTPTGEFGPDDPAAGECRSALEERLRVVRPARPALVDGAAPLHYESDPSAACSPGSTSPRCRTRSTSC